jgi:endoribonuclease LACTB2
MREAVTIVMICGDEIFSIIRQDFMRVFPGQSAFPGGKVDDSDIANPLGHELLDKFDLRLINALAREGKEELDLNLVEEANSGNLLDLNLLGCAVTPEFNPYRFATYFYKLTFKQKPNFIIDESEAAWAGWKKSSAILEDYNSAKIMAVPPIIHTLKELGRDISVSELPRLNFRYDQNLEVPWIESIKGVVQVMPLSNTLLPADRTNAFFIGDVLIDPSPKDTKELEKFEYTIKDFQINKIMLTHHHPDHIQFSNSLAKKNKWPIFLSKFTHKTIKEKFGDNFFDEIETHYLKEGDILTKSLGLDVLVYEVPGHDAGQLALAPTSMNWFLAGDLFQGIGTVVVGDSEGNMADYFKSLERVIALKPKRVIPSHGIALGGTHILEQNLKHRKKREQEVKELSDSGLEVDQILEKIYKDVDKRLWKYARKNIVSHLEKILEERNE